MKEAPRNLEPGRPARPGQLILERRRRIAESVAPNSCRGGRLLDIGCGNGAQTVLLKELARCIVGTDIFHLRETEKPDQSGIFRFVQASGIELPFQDSTFDLATAFEVLEHVPDDALMMREAFRVLRSGGAFLFSVPNKWWIFESHGGHVPAFGWLPLNRIPFFSWLPDSLHSRWAHARIYTMGRARKLALAAGLVPVAAGYITAPLDVLPDGAFRNTLRKLAFGSDTTSIPFKAVNLFVVATKP